MASYSKASSSFASVRASIRIPLSCYHFIVLIISVCWNGSSKSAMFIVSSELRVIRVFLILIFSSPLACVNSDESFPTTFSRDCRSHVLSILRETLPTNALAYFLRNILSLPPQAKKEVISSASTAQLTLVLQHITSTTEVIVTGACAISSSISHQMAFLFKFVLCCG